MTCRGSQGTYLGMPWEVDRTGNRAVFIGKQCFQSHRLGDLGGFTKNIRENRWCTSKLSLVSCWSASRQCMKVQTGDRNLIINSKPLATGASTSHRLLSHPASTSWPWMSYLTSSVSVFWSVKRWYYLLHRAVVGWNETKNVCNELSRNF